MHEQNTSEKSYNLHEHHIIENYQTDKEKIIETISNENHFGYWKYTTLMNVIQPLFEKDDKWLTIGDFYGLDAHYIKKHNIEVIASDLSDVILSELSKEGYIGEYRAENVENISLENNSLEYVITNAPGV